MRAVGGELNNVPVPPAAGAADPDAVGVADGDGRRRRRRRSAASSPGSPTSPASASGSSPPRRTSACRPTSAAGSTRWACSPPTSSPTSSARTACCAGSRRPAGHHIELGISEMNLFLLLHALGLGHELHGEHLLPDRHGLRPVRVPRPRRPDLRRSTPASRFVVVGTPAGITLAPEGGAHQSTITPSIGLELPGAHVRRAGLRAGPRLAAVRRAGPPRRPRRRRRCTCGCRPGRSTRRRSPPRVDRTGPSGSAPTCSPAATGCASRTADPADVVLADVRAGRARGARRGRRCWPTRASPPLVLDLTSPDRLYRGWRDGCAAAARAAAGAAGRPPPRPR